MLWRASVLAELAFPLLPVAQAFAKLPDESLHRLYVGDLDGPPEAVGAAPRPPSHSLEDLLLEAQHLAVHDDAALHIGQQIGAGYRVLADPWAFCPKPPIRWPRPQIPIVLSQSPRRRPAH